MAGSQCCLQGPFYVLLVTFLSINICGRSYGHVKLKEPLSTVGEFVVRRGSTFWFNWKFTLDTAKEDKLLSFCCGYKNFTTKTLIPLASKNGSSPFEKATDILPGYIERVRVFPLNDTFAVQQLRFSDQKKYFCNITYSWYPLNSPREIKSMPLASSNLVVQGPPEFCAPNPSKQLSKSLGARAIIQVTVCQNPPGFLTYQWSHEVTSTSIKLTEIDINKYQGSIVTNALTKDYCGRWISFYIENRFGRLNSSNIKVNVLFDPSKPIGLQAFMANETCYKVQWTTENTGNCPVNYTIKLKDANDVAQWTRTVDSSIGSLSWCPNITANITRAGIKVDTLNGSQTYSVKVVSATPNPPTPNSPTHNSSTNEGKSGAISNKIDKQGPTQIYESDTTALTAGLSAALVFFMMLSIVFAILFFKQKKISKDYTKSKGQTIGWTRIL